MKFITASFCLIIFTFSALAQKAEPVLATANGQNFTVNDLSPETRELWAKLPAKTAEARTELLSRQIVNLLLETESSARKITVEKLLESEVKNKVPEPTAAQIQAVFDANRAAIGNKTLAEIRPDIVTFLRREPEQKALSDFVADLKTKYKVTLGKDVNAPFLQPGEILAAIGSKQITVKDFEEQNKLALYDFQANSFDRVKDDLENNIFSNLVIAEAKAQNIDSSDLIAKEITDKMREFSDEEREKLQFNFQKRLFAKYNAKFLLKEPAPVAQNISADDDPAQGKTDAPVTVVMFSDFQCPACAATHPVLKRVLAEYGEKVRFIVRDYPLVNHHENAFQAARAASAAGKQGKFFEYTEILYRNQDKLDMESLKKYAADLGLNLAQFELDWHSEKTAEEIRKDMADGKSYGITGTPTIFINGVKVRRLSAQGFRNAIEKALN